MIFLKVFFLHNVKLFSLQPFLNPYLPLLQNPCAKGIVYFSVPVCLKTFYSCHRVSGVLISILYFWLPGCTLGFGFCMHMLIMTSAFYLMHHYTILAF